MTDDHEPGSKAPLTGRAAAFQAVRAVLQGRGFVQDVLERLRRAGRVDPREAGFATEVALGAVRHRLTIEHILRQVATYDPRRVRPELRALLHTATYQLVWMDRVPDFAAVDESVTFARRRLGSRPAGMLNAVLRNLTRAIETRRTRWQRGSDRQVRVSWPDACAFSRPVLPRGEPGPFDAIHLAAAAGEALHRCRRLAEVYGGQCAEAVLWASQAIPPVVLQPNRLRIGAVDFETRVRSELSAEAAFAAGAAFLSSGAGLPNAALLREGLAYVQDVTARGAAELVEARPGERVLDLCAAPGGKTIALAQAMHDQGTLVSADVSAERIERLKQSIGRLQLQSVRVVQVSASHADPVGMETSFDAVLVDAPCSNSGVLARRPEARFRLTPERLRALAHLQQGLLERAAGATRVGGRLVYSTCSIEPQENAEVVRAFLQQRPGWRLDAERLTLPAWGPQPGDWRDGGYAVRLQRLS